MVHEARWRLACELSSLLRVGACTDWDSMQAYEWNFSDVNPPVHAWYVPSLLLLKTVTDDDDYRATFRVFKIERKMHGREDLHFLERVFQKLLINFTWWVNRKDEGGNNVFEGGFLGLDNISPFNRSEKLPTGGTLRQADGTGWMAFYCLSMYVSSYSPDLGLH